MYFKKLVLPVLLLITVQLAFAQKDLPAYPEVLRHFFSKYSYEPVEYIHGLQFAKKKGGWFVHIINRQTEEVLHEQLFWSRQKKSYQPVSGFKQARSRKEQELDITALLLHYSFYGYERSPYYGYPGWDIDIIRDFGKADLYQLKDTVLDGLGRAYSAYASRFLWLQYGGYLPTDSTKSPLSIAELPSPTRIDSVGFYLRKAIAVFDVLRQKAPGYQSIVGNAGMKKFNEQVHGYMQMLMCGREDLAMDFLKEISPNETIRKLARNYLLRLPENSILFTHGDNDTYPLLYLQEAENFRKDVTVLNSSLLLLPAYVDHYRKKGNINFSTSPAVYKDSAYMYSVFSPNDAYSDTAMGLSEFLSSIVNKKFLHPYQDLISYPVKQLVMEVDTVQLASLSGTNGFLSRIEINLGDYLTIDQFLILDIIHTNLYQRPVYFAAPSEPFNDYLQQEGMVWRFLPLDPEKGKDLKLLAIQNAEKFLNGFAATPSAELSSGIAPGHTLDDIIYALYADVAQYYLDQNEQLKAKEWIRHLYRSYNQNLPVTPGFDKIARVQIDAGEKQQGLALLEKYLSYLLREFRTPSAVGYLPRDFISKKAGEIQGYLNEKSIRHQKIGAMLGQLLDN